MPIDLSGRAIFLASPGNLTEERETCRQTISAFNEDRANPQRVHFLVKGWEQLPGGVGRPQGMINPHLDSCDFMILMLGDQWGSAPALDGPYSSGTEEEFHRCRELLAAADADMRDLLVLFKTIDAERLRDPGEQLRKVMSFRNGLEKSKSLMYDTFDSHESLSSVVTRKLADWAAPLGDRVPCTLNLPEEMIPVESSDSTPAQMLEAAKKHAADGLRMQAEACFAHAIKDGDPEALTEFALFMRRTGRLDKALELNKQLLEDPALLGRTDAAAVGYKTGSLANMGVIHRKRGELTQSRDLLHEAVITARASAEPINEKLCYALDNYGLTLSKILGGDAAIGKFEEAHALRQDFGSAKDLAQSAINIGRGRMCLGDYAAAQACFTEALGLQEDDPDDHVMANALAGLAESKLRQAPESHSDILELLSRALKINERIQNSDGVSITHALHARLLLLRGEPDSAEAHARSSKEESEKSNNSTGRGTAAWLLAEVALAKGDTLSAKELLQESIEHAGKAKSELLDRDISDTVAKLSAPTNS